jgi:thiol-disulfide isomerase/thioredoxin
MMKKILLYALCLLPLGTVSAQESTTAATDSISVATDSLSTDSVAIPQTVISGSTSPERYGATIELHSNLDGILNSDSILASTSIDSKGNFKFEFNPAFSGAVFIPLDAVNGFMFIEKDSSYNIALPPPQTRTRAEQFNPYFRPASMILSIVEPQESDATVQISAFEDAFDQYYMRALTSNNRDSIEGIISLLQKQSGKSKSAFVEDYKRFRYALLASMLPPERPEWALSYINQTNIDRAYASPAFWEVFNLLFDNFMTAFPNQPEQQDIEHAIRQKDMEMMDAILETTFGIQSPTLRQLVIIKGLTDLYNRTANEEKRDNDKRTHLLSILQQYSNSNITPRNRNIAQAVAAKLKKTNTGEPAYDFRLPDEKGRMHSLSDFKGDYVYLHFVNAFISSSKRDLQVLSQFAKRYKDFKVINIFVYNAAEDLLALPPNLRQDMTNLLWNNNATLLSEYEISNLPSFYLIDPQGKFLFSPSPSPGEGFEAKYSKMMLDLEQEKKAGR